MFALRVYQFNLLLILSSSDKACIFLSWPGLEVIKLFLCSTQLSMKFQLLIKSTMLKKKKNFLAFKLSGIVFIMPINVKMPTIVGILTFMSKINFMLS